MKPSELRKAVSKWIDKIPEDFQGIAKLLGIDKLWKKATSGKKGDHESLKAVAHVLLSFWPSNEPANKDISSVLY